ncbi:MAG: DUF2147 domain-containing protein [Bacteroidota bacterium]
MKQILLFAILISLSFVIPKTADNVIGTYYSPDKGGKIEIYKRNGKFYGKTTCCDATRKDIKNPNPQLRSRSRIGMDFVFDMQYQNGKYTNGKVYNPENGKTYDANMWLEKGNRELHMRGYIGSSFLGKTVVFERVR